MLCVTHACCIEIQVKFKVQCNARRNNIYWIQFALLLTYLQILVKNDSKSNYQSLKEAVICEELCHWKNLQIQKVDINLLDNRKKHKHPKKWLDYFYVKFEQIYVASYLSCQVIKSYLWKQCNGIQLWIIWTNGILLKKKCFASSSK